MKAHHTPPAILLMGPTASGKTAAALRIAETLPIEIISVDSAQVFRDMNIGTAKPSVDELSRIPHHLIDLISPEESYSAAQFRSDALHCMQDIVSRKKIPLLTGGTMLYFKALLHGLADLPQADPSVRQSLDLLALQFGWPHLHAELSKVDPKTASKLSPNDSQRIQRALEIFQQTGTPMSALIANQGNAPPPYKFISIGLAVQDRSRLHKRIEQRFDLMLEQGLEDEVTALRNKYSLTPELPSMRCVGYRQVWEAQENKSPREDMRNKGIFATRQLAKRQLTWMTNTLKPHTFDCESKTLLQDMTTYITEQIA